MNSSKNIKTSKTKIDEELKKAATKKEFSLVDFVETRYEEMSKSECKKWVDYIDSNKPEVLCKAINESFLPASFILATLADKFKPNKKTLDVFFNTYEHVIINEWICTRNDLACSLEAVSENLKNEMVQKLFSNEAVVLKILEAEKGCLPRQVSQKLIEEYPSFKIKIEAIYNKYFSKVSQNVGEAQLTIVVDDLAKSQNSDKSSSDVKIDCPPGGLAFSSSEAKMDCPPGGLAFK